MKQKSKKFIVILFLSLIFLGLISFGVYRFFLFAYLSSFVKKEVTIEYGNIVSSNDIVSPLITKDISFSLDLGTLRDVGDYDLVVFIDNQEFEVRVRILDTTPPLLTVRDLEIYIDQEVPTVDDFILEIADLSSYELVPLEIESLLGVQEVEVIVRDKYGNENIKKAQLTIKEDKEPPLFGGLTDLECYVGEKPDIRAQVTAVDARFGNVSFSVDDSSVNYYIPGEYKARYYAQDPLGNEKIEERNLRVLEKSPTYFIANFPTYNQYPNYPNGCESIALYNLLRYYGVSVTPEEIVDRLRKGDGVYFEGNTLYGGDPEIEFVGDPRDPHGYGVYEKPIMEVAHYYKKGMINFTGHSLDEVLELVKVGIPVQVWGSIHNQDTSVCASWTHRDSGKNIDWICDLHSVILIGFHRDSVFVSDSYTGKIEEYSREQFEKMYNKFGKRALYYSY